MPTQQVAAARLRARESGRWVVQVGPTGYSAVIDPLGRVRWRSRLGAAALYVATVERRRGVTPGQHFDTDLLLLNVVSLWTLLRLIRRRRRRVDTPDSTPRTRRYGTVTSASV